MYYVYLLRKYKDSEIYVGYSNNLKRRFGEHNRGGRVWELLYYEAYKARKDAMVREKRLKQYGKALGQLKRRLQHSLIMPQKVRDASLEMIPRERGRDTDFCDQIIDLNNNRDSDTRSRI